MPPEALMPFDPQTKTPLVSLLLLAALGLTSAGCAGDGGKVIAEATGMATTAQEPKAFVRETRPADPAYIPVGRPFRVAPLCRATLQRRRPSFRPGKPRISSNRPDPRKPNEDCKKRAAFKTIEADLEAKRLSMEAAGNAAKALGSTPPPKPARLPTN